VAWASVGAFGVLLGANIAGLLVGLRGPRRILVPEPVAEISSGQVL